ncbi:response regulator transcription factor [Shouchella patagoniensis]|uniref:response regulator transcription factor n=1 Tax=Shouchella patagoniensis TaxID=228576 RepID=UPI0009954C2B|nr:response regulator transcription factor [Shouchella patagoniensis]
MSGKIVVVEDDEQLSRILADKLTKYQYKVICHSGSKDLLELITVEQPELVLLDINLPTYDGFYWCRQIRSQSKCPILFISARESELDQIRALENGGDDYVAKPFTTEVLIAKVRSHIRRAYGEYASGGHQTIDCGELRLSYDKLELKFRNQTSFLSKKEALLLQLLMKKQSGVVDRQMILSKLWDESEFIDENTLNVNISRVRKQLQLIQAPHRVIAVRGIGYRLTEGE